MADSGYLKIGFEQYQLIGVISDPKSPTYRGVPVYVCKHCGCPVVNISTHDLFHKSLEEKGMGISRKTEPSDRILYMVRCNDCELDVPFLNEKTRDEYIQDHKESPRHSKNMAFLTWTEERP